MGRQKEADQYFLVPCSSRQHAAHNINFFRCNICLKQPLARHSDNENNIEFEKEILRVKVKQHTVEQEWGIGEITSRILTSALGRDEWPVSSSGVFNPRERVLGDHWPPVWTLW